MGIGSTADEDEEHKQFANERLKELAGKKAISSDDFK